MTLIKNDKTVPNKIELRRITWPIERLPEGIGLSVLDGWNFGIGFGVAIVIAIPVASLILGIVIMLLLLILSSLGVVL